MLISVKQVLYMDGPPIQHPGESGRELPLKICELYHGCSLFTPLFRFEVMENTTGLLTVESIRKCVYTIRGQQVMIDSDLADIYGYELKAMNQQVKRNIERFPEDFMFQLNQEEIPNDYLKSQFVTLNESGNKRGLHIKKMPYAFTEQGIYMLATVLKALIFFDKMYEPMNEAERREFLTQFIEKGEIYEEEQENGQWLKSIEFKLPIISKDMKISLDNGSQIETVVLMSRVKE